MADSRPAVLQAAGRSHAAVSAHIRPHVKLIGVLALGHLGIDVHRPPRARAAQ